jgi:hypothetical protein
LQAFASKTVNIEMGGKEWAFALSPLPLNIYDLLEEELPTPKPPISGFFRNKKNQLEYDNRTGKPIPIEDKTDQAYRKELQEIQQLQSVALIARALEGDSNVTFEATREKFKTAREYYQALRKEMLPIFSFKTFSKLLDEVGKMTAINTEDIEEAKKSFL